MHDCRIEKNREFKDYDLASRLRSLFSFLRNPNIVFDPTLACVGSGLLGGNCSRKGLGRF